MKIPFHLLALATTTTTRAYVQRSAMTAGARISSSTTTMGRAIRQLQMASSSAHDIQTGVVKWFDTKKGFGFIVPDNDNGGGDIFVHQTAIQADGFRSLAEGEAVEYLVEEDSNGRRKAMQVTGPNGSDVQGQPFRPSNDYDSF